MNKDVIKILEAGHNYNNTSFCIEFKDEISRPVYCYNRSCHGEITYYSMDAIKSITTICPTAHGSSGDCWLWMDFILDPNKSPYRHHILPMVSFIKKTTKNTNGIIHIDLNKKDQCKLYDEKMLLNFLQTTRCLRDRVPVFNTYKYLVENNVPNNIAFWVSSFIVFDETTKMFKTLSTWHDHMHMVTFDRKILPCLNLINNPSNWKRSDVFFDRIQTQFVKSKHFRTTDNFYSLYLEKEEENKTEGRGYDGVLKELYLKRQNERSSRGAKFESSRFIKFLNENQEQLYAEF